MPLTAEEKAAWLDALKSDKYAKTTGVLFEPRGYCCLGVLAKAVLGMDDDELRLRAGYGADSAYSRIRKRITGTHIDALINLNDGEYHDRKSFTHCQQLIEYIEEKM